MLGVLIKVPWHNITIIHTLWLFGAKRYQVLTWISIPIKSRKLGKAWVFKLCYNLFTLWCIVFIIPYTLNTCKLLVSLQKASKWITRVTCTNYNINISFLLEQHACLYLSVLQKNIGGRAQFSELMVQTRVASCVPAYLCESVLWLCIQRRKWCV